MASSMATAAKVPASPWPLMKMALYFWGSRPTRPNRLPCSTAPNAGEKESIRSPISAGFSLSLSLKHRVYADLQLMNQIVAMVTEKKRSSSMGTLTSTAVRMNNSRMKTRLPATRIASDILKTQPDKTPHSWSYKRSRFHWTPVVAFCGFVSDSKWASIIVTDLW